MSKEDLKIKPVEQELTMEDLKGINGGHCKYDGYDRKNNKPKCGDNSGS